MKASNMAPGTTAARSLSPIRDSSAPAAVGKGSRIRMIKEIVKLMPTKPLAKLERKGVLTKVAEKKVPGAKIEKSESAAPADDAVANNIFFPSVPKEEESSSSSIQNVNETLQTETKLSCFPTQNQMSDFTVTDQSLTGMSVGPGAVVDVNDIECAEGDMKAVENVISPNQERTPPDNSEDKEQEREQEQEDYVFIEHAEPETEEKTAVIDAHNTEKKKTEGDISKEGNEIVTDAPVACTLDNKSDDTLENCEFIEHSEVTEARDEEADHDYDVDENSFEVDNENEIEKEMKNKTENVNENENESVGNREHSVKNESTDDANKITEKTSSTPVSPRHLIPENEKEIIAINANIASNKNNNNDNVDNLNRPNTLNNDEIKSRFESLDGSHSDESCVVECPLVEGLGQEHAFRRRKSSIQVYISIKVLMK